MNVSGNYETASPTITSFIGISWVLFLGDISINLLLILVLGVKINCTVHTYTDIYVGGVSTGGWGI